MLLPPPSWRFPQWRSLLWRSLTIHHSVRLPGFGTGSHKQGHGRCRYPGGRFQEASTLFRNGLVGITRFVHGALPLSSTGNVRVGLDSITFQETLPSDLCVIPGAAQRRPGIQWFIFNVLWIIRCAHPAGHPADVQRATRFCPTFAGMTKHRIKQSLLNCTR